MLRKVWLVVIFWLLPLIVISQEVPPFDKVQIDRTDLASLQRGAHTYMNYCAGCHSLKYVRYNTMAQDIGIVNSQGQILDALVKQTLLFTGDKLTATIETAMPADLAANWFGKAPPDLSLVARSRGNDWLYNYLRGFYPDPKRPWGVNNYVFPDVAMPDVLEHLQQTLSVAAYNTAMADLVNFLDYIAEPHKLERERLGVWVLIFLGIFLIFTVLLKKEYWKDVH